jgi:penicillin-binding protein 2
LDLQRDVETLLQQGLEKVKSGRGAVIVMNPNNGELLALVSLPSYDNNDFAKGISSMEYSDLVANTDRPLFPRATSGLLPSGSTFKLIVAATALAEGIISPSTSIVSTGGVRVGRWFFPDWKAGGHGVTNVTKAIAESVNTFFYVIGGGNDAFPNIHPLGIARIAEYARKFGLGKRTGVDLPNESEGFVPTPEWKEEQRNESWYVGDTYHVAIGQGDILVTPIQVARYTAVFANGGHLTTPRLVSSIIGPAGQETVLPSSLSAEPIVSPTVVKSIREGMRQAVTQGSARSLNVPGWNVAAKTGTAQWHPTKEPHAWFTSFAPFDKPEIVVTVVVEEGGEGSGVGAAVAKAIYTRYFTGKLVDVYAQPPAVAPAESVRDVMITDTTDSGGTATEPPGRNQPPVEPPKTDKPRNPVTSVIEWIFDSQ